MPPHILIINHEYPPTGGGAATASAHIAREMAAAGIATTVLTSAFGGAPRREQDGMLTIVRIPALRRQADKSGIIEFCTFLLSALWWAVRSGGKDKGIPFTACIAFFGLPAGPAAWTLRALYGIPYIVSLRGGDVPGFLPVQLARWHRWTGWLLRFLWRRAKFVVANSAGLTQLAHTFAPEVPVLTIPNGVDSAHFCPATASAAMRDESAPCRFLFSGRLNVQKNLPCLLRALRLLPHDNWSLTLVGDGPEREALQRMIHDFGWDKKVHILGWLPRAALTGALQEAHVYVFPSIQEGMPNTVLEAMACGLPVIACRIEGCEELVQDGENGLLLPPDDAPALAVALQRLSARPELCRCMGLRGRERVQRQYTWKATAEKYLTLCTRTS